MSAPPWTERGIKIYENYSNLNVETIDNILRSMNYTGDRYYVDRDVGSDLSSTTGTYDDPFKSIDYAVGRCTANNGDVIIILPSTSEYDENANAGGVEVDVAGIAIVMPLGSQVQIINSHASASAVITVTADNVTIIGGYIGEDTTTVEGIVTTSVDDVMIYNTIFSGNMENGVHISAGNRCYVVNCYFYYITNDGIEISGASTQNYLLRNYLTRSSDNSIHLNGNGVDDNVVVDNIINGGGTNGINVELGDANLISGGFISGCTYPTLDTGTDNTWNVPVDTIRTSSFNRTVADSTNEDTGDIDDIDLPSSGKYEIILDVDALDVANEGGTITFRLYQKVDDTNYRIVDKVLFLEGTDEVQPTLSGSFEGGSNRLRVSHQTSSAVTANRVIYYKIVQER